MKIIKTLLLTFNALIVFVFPSLASGQVHWSGSIKHITVKYDGSAYIFIQSPYSPNPAGSLWNCSDDVVHLGSVGTPVNKAFLSQALAAYAAKSAIRFGVNGSGGECTTLYITAR